MAKLGSPITNEFSIGVAEVRVGPLTSAGQLTQSHSIGIVDDVTVSFSATSVDLKTGFPQVIAATAVTEQAGSLKVTAREFSRRNLDLILGNAVSATAVSVATTVNASYTADAATMVLASATGLAAGDIITIYPAGQPENVSIARIESIATNTITFTPGTEPQISYSTGAKVFKSHGVAAGNVTSTNYFSVSVVQQKVSTGAPVVWNFWKAANSGSMEQGMSVSDFASLSMEFKILQPTATDTGLNGDLHHMESIIASYPYAGKFGGSDTD